MTSVYGAPNLSQHAGVLNSVPSLSMEHIMQQAIWCDHPFIVYELRTEWHAVPGLYIFAGIQDGMWKPLYVGKTDSFRDRLTYHDKWNQAIALGMTHIHASVLHDARARAQLEQQFISMLQPPLNVQHRKF